MVGKLMPDFFPKIFGPAPGPAARRGRGEGTRFADLAKQVGEQVGEEIADGFIRIAVENMANAIKKISVQRGYDVTRYALNCFGGAGGQHACLVADALGMTRVLIHPFSSLLSAYGMGLADIRATRQQAIEEPFGRSRAGNSIAEIGGRLGDETRDEVAGQGVPAAKITVYVRAHIRYAGTDTALVVDAGTARRDDSAPSRRRTRRASASSTQSKQLVVEAVSVEAVGGGAKFSEPERPRTREPAARAGAPHEVLLQRRAGTTPACLYPRPAQARPQGQGRRHHHRAAPDHRGRGRLAGRADGEEPPGAVARRTRSSATHAIGTQADPVMLEVFNNLFMSIAEQMGVSLQNTAYSVNIKERLDFSCAVFAHDGTLVANAPHMPVHLGSMDRSVETIIRDNKGKIAPGDVYAINAPYNGGTHLPDITVCTPVFDDAQKKILFWVASRGHHADVGGISPGSMSPNATTIEQEGVYMDNFKLVDRGRFRETGADDALLGAKYPARNPVQNVNDMKAQIAANEKGVAGAAQDGGAVHACRWCRPTCSTCRTTPPKACGA